ncbi:helix-turn-helix domain-containing protein [Rhodoluna lacicola]|uniref:helix-turn-helix domain-containing protein n=1 Tax=Rhodoluna lacicola TaxID=529884 RepID=UPI00222EE292|nr:helix-turn-helix domain-containing protein [Rhodoluna lacicola]BDS50975.1 hypothetical protein RKACHI23_12370 [Rhodoluna lacicola]
MKSKTKYISAEELFAEMGFDPEAPANKAAIAEMLAEQDAVVLSDLRKTLELTQTDVAQKLSVSQNRVSQIELADLGTIQIETLRNYLAALGGELILGAYINGEILVIREKAPE